MHKKVGQINIPAKTKQINSIAFDNKQLAANQYTKQGHFRILHLINGLFDGGGQRVVLDLLNSLAGETGLDVRLCLLGNNNMSLADIADYSIPFDGRYNNPLVLAQAARRLRKIVNKEEFDLVHTHGLDADLIGGFAIRGTDVRHICHLHVTPPIGQKESWKAAVRRRLFRWLTNRPGTRFIAVSRAVGQAMAKYYDLHPERISTVLNGVAVANFPLIAPCNDTQPCKFSVPDEKLTEKRFDHRRGIVSNRIVIGSAGRLQALKGFEFLLEAAELLMSTGVEFEIRIAGTGSKQECLEAHASDLGVRESIRFVGHVQDMVDFYRGLDIFVLPSLSEGLPLVILEAMAMGRPVVATRLPGVLEVIRDGVDGILAPPGDQEALANAIRRLSENALFRHRLAQNGNRRVLDKFTIDRVTREVVAVYLQMLAKSNRRRS